MVVEQISTINRICIRCSGNGPFSVRDNICRKCQSKAAIVAWGKRNKEAKRAHNRAPRRQGR